MVCKVQNTFACISTQTCSFHPADKVALSHAHNDSESESQSLRRRALQQIRNILSQRTGTPHRETITHPPFQGSSARCPNSRRHKSCGTTWSIITVIGFQCQRQLVLSNKEAAMHEDFTLIDCCCCCSVTCERVCISTAPQDELANPLEPSSTHSCEHSKARKTGAQLRDNRRSAKNGAKCVKKDHHRCHHRHQEQQC